MHAWQTTTYRALAMGAWLLALAVAIYPVMPKTFMPTNQPLKMPTTVRLGKVTSTVFCKIPLENTSSQKVEILGATTGCGCLFPKNVPVSVPAGATIQLDIEFKPKFDNTPGKQRLAMTLQLLTDTDQAVPPVTVFATVISDGNEADEELTPIPM